MIFKTKSGPHVDPHGKRKLTPFFATQTAASFECSCAHRDDEHFGQTVARQLAWLEEGDEKENLKLQIQVLIHNSQ